MTEEDAIPHRSPPSARWASLAEAGFTPGDVLLAATRDAARARVLDDRGTLERGKLADLVVLGADPLASVESLSKIERVLVGGEEVYLASDRCNPPD